MIWHRCLIYRPFVLEGCVLFSQIVALKRFLRLSIFRIPTRASIHTIRKVKFLSKNSILTKPQHFHEFFTQNFFWQFFSWNQSCQLLKSQNHNIFTSFYHEIFDFIKYTVPVQVLEWKALIKSKSLLFHSFHLIFDNKKVYFFSIRCQWFKDSSEGVESESTSTWPHHERVLVECFVRIRNKSGDVLPYEIKTRKLVLVP